MRLSKMDQLSAKTKCKRFSLFGKEKKSWQQLGDVWAENRAENKIFYSLSAPSFVARDVSMECSFVSKSPHLIQGRLTLESGGLSGSRFLNPLGFLRLSSRLCSRSFCFIRTVDLQNTPEGCDALGGDQGQGKGSVVTPHMWMVQRNKVIKNTIITVTSFINVS